MTNKQNDRRDAAIEYVKRWEIFPSPPGTKAGYSKDQHLTDAPWGKTKSVAVVREYWRRLPRANIGVPMGVGSGIFDIECDTVAGHPNLKQDGATSLAALEAKHGKLPLTLMFESPTGSVHRLFRHPGGDVRIKSGAIDTGVDCKGDGNMSIAPPSRTPKGVYRWINKRRIAAAPAWLLELVVQKERARGGPAEHFARFGASGRQVDIAELTLACAMVPNPDCDWESWNRIGMALFAATDGSVEGYRLFAAWSRRSRKYDAGSTSRKWKAFRGCPPREIGAGTVFHVANEAVPDYRDRAIALDPDVIALIEEFHKLMDEEE